jgi:hypothetical protein
MEPETSKFSGQTAEILRVKKRAIEKSHQAIYHLAGAMR